MNTRCGFIYTLVEEVRAFKAVKLDLRPRSTFYEFFIRVLMCMWEGYTTAHETRWLLRLLS